MGKDYIYREDAKLNKYRGKDTKTTYTDRSGKQYALPKYLKNHIIKDDEEREKLWLHILDKEERYINGKRIDISKGLEKYNAILKQARADAKILGYPDNQINKDELEYEKAKRKALRLERIQKIYEINKK